MTAKISSLVISRAAIRYGVIFLAMLACAVLAAMCIPSSARTHTASASMDPKFAVLRIGELLTYRIDWQRYAGAAVAQLRIVDRGEFYGASVWHFRAALHTAEPLRALYPLDDQIDAYASLANLQTREYQEHSREFGRPQDTQASLVFPGEASDAPLPHVLVPQGTRDALSAIYFLRTIDWSRVPEMRAPVFDGENIYQMIATDEKTESIHIAAGDFQTTEIKIRLLDGRKEIADERFALWLASNRARTPVLCEANLPIGVLRIELTSDSAFEAGAAFNRVTPPAHSNPRAGN
ncbi:MAG TPA: DUF3108 domain-containing protein [Candidatus Acidoferrales bacterium]|nr:DUF3108 domain-containing protein [Candidatus Acidoferrales bacterium]